MLLKQRRSSDAPVVPASAAGSLPPVFLLTIVNPMTVVVFAGIVPQLPVAGSPSNAAWFALALCAGSVLVQFLIAGFGAALGSALPGRGPRRAINIAAAAGILAFGIYGLVAV
jgi:threonine/homoserine/homoserine lactone efflux protein